MFDLCVFCKIWVDDENDEEPRGFVELVCHWHFHIQE